MWPFKAKSKKYKFWKSEYNTLADYNSEVAKGIVHTDEWKKKMERLQEEYNERIQEFPNHLVISGFPRTLRRR